MSISKSFDNSKLFRVGISLSCSALSTLLIPGAHYTFYNILFSLIGTFVLVFAGFREITAVIAYDEYKVKIGELIIFGLVAVAYLMQLWSRKNSAGLFPFNAIWYHLLALPAVLCVFHVYKSLITKYFVWLYRKLNKTDVLICQIVFIVMAIMIISLYISNSGWYSSAYKPIKGTNGVVADVLGLDNGGVFYELFSNPQYYDIRHPILTTLAFPAFSVVNTISRILIPNALRNCFNAIVLQLLNMLFLILTGIHIKIATDKREAMLIYYSSFPFILYGLSFEKYQLCVFVITLYWVISKEKRRESAYVYSLACLLMPTSCVIGVKELFGIRHDVKEFIKWGIRVVCACIFLVFLGGKCHILYDGLSELRETSDHFTTMVNFPISYRITATIKMIHNCLLPIPFTVIDRWYTYDDLWSKSYMYLGLAICCICLLGLIVGHRSIYIKSSAVWLSFAFVLFVALNWVPQEAPLFNVYFSWAVILLITEGMVFVSRKLELNEMVVCGGLCFVMSIANLIEIGNICRFYNYMGY